MAGFEISGKKLINVNLRGQTRHLLVVRDSGIQFSDAHPLAERINREFGTDVRVPSLVVANAAQHPRKAWLPDFPIDLLVAHGEKGKPLGREITGTFSEKTRMVFLTGKYCGKSGIVLAVPGLTAADFSMSRGKITFDLADRAVPVPIPEEGGWYLPHEKTGVPSGTQVLPNTKNWELSEYLWIGPGPSIVLASSDSFSSEDRASVHLDYHISSEGGMVVEVPEKDILKFNALIGGRDPSPGSRKASMTIGMPAAEFQKLSALFYSHIHTLAGTSNAGIMAVPLRLNAMIEGAKPAGQPDSATATMTVSGISSHRFYKLVMEFRENLEILSKVAADSLLKSAHRLDRVLRTAQYE